MARPKQKNHRENQVNESQTQNTPKQVRSQMTQDALLKAGRKIFAENLMDKVSVQEIASAAGVSVGGFYARFNNKESFFNVVQEAAAKEILIDTERVMFSSRLADVDLETYIHEIAKMTVRVFRKNRYLYIASIKNLYDREDSWGPIRQVGVLASDNLRRAMEPRLEAQNTTRTLEDYRTVIQVISGLLINAILNDPGPVKLNSPKMITLVAQLITRLLDIYPEAER